MNDGILITPKLMSILEGGARTIGVELPTSESGVIRRELNKCQEENLILRQENEELRK